MEKEITTNELMEFLQENMVTKAEAKNFATKDDIKDMATKDDLKSLKNEIKLEMGTLNQNLLGHIDQKLANLGAEFGKSLKNHIEHENKFKQELVSVMKRNSLLGAKELKHLEQAI